MEMEVEQEQHPLPTSSNSFKRFGLKNSIQTNFGDEYVFQIVPKYLPSLYSFIQINLYKKLAILGFLIC